VIGEITGKRRDEVVVIGGHLDSWDLGTGAIDDAAGVGITMAAGHLIGQRKAKPLRTIRVVAYANEEQGLHGARVYAAALTPDSIAKHQIIAESDFGAGRIYAFNTSSAEAGRALQASKQIAEALAPLGIEYTPGEGGPGSDAGPSAERGVAWAALRQDGTDYFDYHHTPDDTLDKVDPKALAQNAAAYTVFAFLASEAEGGFGSESKAVTPPEE
jgi:Zn-dependent M28 family amino/carboxypeptidase